MVTKLTITAASLPDTPPLEFIEAAASAGYEGVGLRLRSGTRANQVHEQVEWAAICVLGPDTFSREWSIGQGDRGRRVGMLPSLVFSWQHNGSAAHGTTSAAVMDVASIASTAWRYSLANQASVRWR